MAVEYKLRGDASQLKKELQSVTAKEARLTQQTIKTKQGFDKLNIAALRNENALRRAKLATQKVTAAELKFAASTKIATAGLVNQRRVTTGLAAAIGAFRNQVLLTTFALVGAGTVVKKFLDQSSNLQESINAVEVVFGNGAETILNFGETAAESVGLANSEFNQLATVTGALLKDTGIPLDKVAQKTITLARRAADMASVFNTDVKDALGAINQALRGETEAIRRYAGDVTDATLQTFLLAQGIDAQVSAMGSQEKRLKRVDLLLSQTEDTSGDFAKTQDNLANKTRILGSKFKDSAAQIGDIFVPAVEAALNAIDGLFDTIELRVQNLKLPEGGIITAEDLFEGGFAVQAEENMAEFRKRFEAEFKKIQENMMGFNTAGQDATATLASMAEAAKDTADEVDRIKPPAPPGVPFVPVKEVEEILPLMAEQSSLMRNMSDLTFEQLVNLEKVAEIMGEQLPADAVKYLALLRTMALVVPEIPKNIKIVNSRLSDSVRLGRQFTNTLAQAALHGASLKQTFLSIAASFLSFGIGKLFDNAKFGGGGSFVPGFFAHGTSFAPGGPAVVGERGPEIVNLPRGASVTPNRTTNNVTFGNINITNTGGRLNAEDVSRAFNEAVDLGLPVRRGV